jgi:hypothetical protein
MVETSFTGKYYELNLKRPFPKASFSTHVLLVDHDCCTDILLYLGDFGGRF